MSSNLFGFVIATLLLSSCSTEMPSDRGAAELLARDAQICNRRYDICRANRDCCSGLVCGTAQGDRMCVRPNQPGGNTCRADSECSARCVGGVCSSNGCRAALGDGCSDTFTCCSGSCTRVGATSRCLEACTAAEYGTCSSTKLCCGSDMSCGTVDSLCARTNKAFGAGCRFARECRSGVCATGRCAEVPGPLTCDAIGCPSGAQCINSRCVPLFVDGAVCTASSQCDSRMCVAGRCGRPSSTCRTASGSCTRSTDCCAGLTCSGIGFCTATPWCSALGGTCSIDGQCCDGMRCNSGRCGNTTCGVGGTRCTSGAQCCSGLSCVSGSCSGGVTGTCGQQGAVCISGTECCSGQCSFSRCVAPVAQCSNVGGACARQQDCCTRPGIGCGGNFGGQNCCIGLGSPCSSTSECCSAGSGSVAVCASNGRCGAYIARGGPCRSPNESLCEPGTTCVNAVCR